MTNSISRIFILINILVFILWQLALKNYFDLNFMIQNFLVSFTGLQNGFIWTLLASVFSHNSLLHLFFNMFVLNSFGPLMEITLGKKTFIYFYLIAGIFSSACHAAVSNWILHQPDLPALGASGAISGLILLFSLIYPKQKILLFGFIPLPALVGSILFVGLDIWGVVAQAEGGGLPIGHGAHLGGALAGLVFFFILKRRSQFVRQA